MPRADNASGGPLAKAGPPPPTRTMTIVAQDPAVRVGSHVLTAEVDIAAEDLGAGPRGYRVHVVDYDASTQTMYRPMPLPTKERHAVGDNRRLVDDAAFHARNVYAIVMRTLGRFEYALGRRVSWAFNSHQINVVPHAFCDANAFYSRRDQALMFGYFPGRRGMVFSCLSHDVVAHETTHALLDGLRERYNDPSSSDQAAFHEAFADVVALLSVFSLRAIVERLIDIGFGAYHRRLIPKSALSLERLRQSALFGLAEQMGQEMTLVRGKALRRSVDLAPSRDRLTKELEFKEAHRRGEVLVAAILNAFIRVWTDRLADLGQVSGENLSRPRVAEEGCAAADYLLTMAIRALDYAPPVDLQFADFLSALLTADREIRPDDSKYQFRRALRDYFAAYGIDPPKHETDADGYWLPPDGSMRYDLTHFESMQRDPDEVFRFIWENRRALHLYEDAFSRVLSVRPCLRIAPDGFWLRETVAEYFQTITLEARELRPLRIRKPDGMPDDQEVVLYGGGALIFDEHGRLKFHVANPIMEDGKEQQRQTERLDQLWAHGAYNKGASLQRRFSQLHRQRATQATVGGERW